jgi:hypothetical protein
LTDAPSKRPRRLAAALLVLAAAVLLLAIAAYASRRMLAREALVGWLKARGVASEAQIDEIGFGGLSGRIRIGDPAAPDFTAADVEATYGFRGLSLELRSVTLRRPVLRARLHAGQLSLGRLDPIIAEFRKRPPRPNAAKPSVRIEDGQVLLATDYGPLRIAVDAQVDDGKLMRLSAAADPARLKGGGIDARLGRATLETVTRGGRIGVRFFAPVEAFSGLELDAARATVTADLPYPDLVKRRGDGRVAVAADLSARRLGVAGASLDEPHFTAAFTGQAAGWIDDLAVTGRAVANLAADGKVGQVGVSGLRLALTSEDARWTRKGGDRVQAGLRLTGEAERADAGQLQLRRLVLAASGPFRADRGGAHAELGGSFVGRGRWTGLGAPAAGDGAQLAAIKRAAQGFRIAAPAFAVALAPQPGARLVQPLRLLPDRGGEVRIVQAGNIWRATVAGGGLPRVDASLAHATLQGGDLTLKAQASLGPVEQGTVSASGQLRLANGGASFSAARCVAASARRLAFGDRSIDKLSGRLCPAGRPVLSFTDGAWRVAGRVEGASADAAWLQAHVAEAQGSAAFTYAQGHLSGRADGLSARVTDAAPQARFNPLDVQGAARLAADVWTADLSIRSPAGPQVASARLRHEVETGRGGLEIATGTLRFAPGGLQPEQLSPLAAAIGSPATGAVSFTGGFTWAPGGNTSSGTLDIASLDFKSPAGPVEGLSGQVAFTSLAPLVTQPGQTLTARRLDAIVPVTDLKVGFDIRDEALHITGGEAAVEGGRVTIERLDAPFAGSAPLSGVLGFEGVQLSSLVEASPFGPWMDLDAKVSGRIPFESRGGQVRITDGDLKAIEPGRLSIHRELFTGAAADVKTEAATPAASGQSQTFTGLAYQAMEDLAFDELAATINSSPDGRLGVLFHIRGRHDPPQEQQIRLSLMDLILKRFLGRPLPLPSGTQVNLTLDTSLNLNDLLAEYAELHGSAPVQPPK